MNKEKDAQFTVRNLNEMSKTDHRLLLRWLKKVIKQVEKRDESYAPVANWSLMK